MVTTRMWVRTLLAAAVASAVAPVGAGERGAEAAKVKWDASWYRVRPTRAHFPVPGPEVSRAWYILRQVDIGGLLHGLPQRLGKAVRYAKLQQRMSEEDGGGGRLVLDIVVEGGVEGDIVVGFFADPRWYLAEPVQVRRFPGPGRYTVDGLVPGPRQVGAMIGTAVEPNALGVHRTWPEPVEVARGKPAEAQLRISPEFRDERSGVFHEMRRAGAGEFGKGRIDLSQLITVRTVDTDGSPVPFCRIVYFERSKQDPAEVLRFHEGGTDDRGFGHHDRVESFFSLSASCYDFAPETMVARGRYKRMEHIHNAQDRPQVTVRWEPYPTGTGTVRGRVHNQHGQPLSEYTLWLTLEQPNQGLEGFRRCFWKLPATHPDGRFEVSGLPSGKYKASVRAFDYPTHAGGISEKHEFILKDEPNAVARLEIEVEAKQLYYGRALYEDGAPIYPGAHCARFEKPDPRRAMVWSFAEGILPGGLFRICLSRREREALLEASDGRIAISAGGAQLGQVHIDKLSRDPARPARVVFARREPEPRPPRPDEQDAEKAFHGCLEAKYDTGKPEVVRNWFDGGPAIRIRVRDFLPDPAEGEALRLHGLRVYARRYGAERHHISPVGSLRVVAADGEVLKHVGFEHKRFAEEPGWGSIVFWRPLNLGETARVREFTVALDPRSRRHHGLEFYASRVEGASHSLFGSAGDGLTRADGLEWLIHPMLSSRRPAEF